MMRKLLSSFLLSFVFISVLAPGVVGAQNFADCNVSDNGRPNEYVMGIPAWWRGLPVDADGNVQIDKDEVRDTANSTCQSGNPILIIAFNVFDAALRIAGMVAVVFVIVGGFKYTLSDGNPQKAASARGTIIHGLVGGAIAALSAGIVTLIVGRLS